MRRPPLFLAPLFLTLFLATSAFAQPRVQSAEECGIAADMAIVARSLAQEQVLVPKATTIMQRIYDVGASQRGTDLMNDIIAAAYKKDAAVTSQVFAEELFTTCLKTGGNLDLVLGKRL
jgi:hypothetical protein